MNKEEMAKAYADGFLNKYFRELAYDAFLHGYEAKLSLPANLYDAAKNKVGSIWDTPLGREQIELFKAGAEWMAGQGASYNTEVGWIDGPTVLDWPDNILDEFKMGDEVIVQIRKKQ